MGAPVEAPVEVGAGCSEEGWEAPLAKAEEAVREAEDRSRQAEPEGAEDGGASTRWLRVPSGVRLRGPLASLVRPLSGRSARRGAGSAPNGT